MPIINQIVKGSGGSISTGIGTSIMFFTELDPSDYTSMIIQVSINSGTPMSIDFKNNAVLCNYGDASHPDFWYLNYIISNQNLDPMDGTISGDVQVAWVVDNGVVTFDNAFGFVDDSNRQIPVFVNEGYLGAP